MIRVGEILRDYLDAGAMSSLIGLFGFVDEHTFLTKSGDLGVVFRLAGADAECLDHSQRDQIARRFESAIRSLDERFRVYQYLLKRNHAAIPHRHCENSIVDRAISNRIAYLASKSDSLYTFETYAVVMLENWRRGAAWSGRLRGLLSRPQSVIPALLAGRNAVTILEQDLDRARELLSHKATSLLIQLRDTLGLELLSRDAAFGFFRRLANLAPHKLDAKLKYDMHLDFFACDSALECYRDHLRMDGYFVQVLTLKEPPSQTFAHLLRALDQIPCNCLIANEWRREPNLFARREIQSKRRHFHNAKASFVNYLGDQPLSPSEMLIDDGAAGLVADLGSCLREIEIAGNYFGRFSLTIVLYDKDRTRLRRAVAECFKVFSSHDAALIEERFNQLNAFLATIPGNRAFNLRPLWLLNTNYADLSFLFTPRTGDTRNNHLNDEYLAVLETNSSTPYFLNLHYQDVAHTMILGATGAGKSFLLNFLITHLQKYQPLTYVFDLGGSYGPLTELFGGGYFHLGIEKRPFTINPFRLAPTPENLQFLYSFVKVLVESGGYTMNGREERDLYDQIGNVYEVDEGQRRLFTLANIVSRNVAEQLRKWVEGGQYGALFDNLEDNLSLAPFQTFDFEGMAKYPQILEPLLFYVLHRANASIHDPELATRLKVFVMDEAWRFLNNPITRHYIAEALKTWRKRNAAMILATQSSDDLERSEMLRFVVESCPSKMFLANPGMDRQAYRELFHLNETEAATIAGLVPKQQILIKRPDFSKVVQLNVDPASYWLYTSNPYDNQRRCEAFEQHGFVDGLEFLARSSQ
jgi:type IV secretion/conjugal transfer VirB4 family ATPase